jgi:hypothetical protein
MLTSLKHQGADSSLPFDNHLLDRLMDQAHIDVTLTTSKHNVQYLLGGHRTFFFDHMEAMGPSRYLPVLAKARRNRLPMSAMGLRISSMRSVRSGHRRCTLGRLDRQSRCRKRLTICGSSA